MARGISVVLTVVALWALWWPLTAWRETGATENWLDDRRAAGWLAEADDVSVTGFPLSYARQLTGLALADPATGWAVQTDRAVLSRPRHPELSEPGHTLALPAPIEVQTTERRFSVTSDSLQATLVQAAEGDLLSKATVSVEGLALTGTDDWRASLASGTLVAAADPEAPERVEIALTAADLVPPAGITLALRRADLAPPAIERLEVEAEVVFERPWRLAVLDGPRPQPTRISLDGSGLRWGELTLRVAGSLSIDRSGLPEGELLVKATNWRDLLAAGVAAGAIPEGLSGALETGLELASRFAGSPDTLDIPLTFSNGRIRSGPVPVGPAPILRLR